MFICYELLDFVAFLKDGLKINLLIKINPLDLNFQILKESFYIVNTFSMYNFHKKKFKIR